MATFWKYLPFLIKLAVGIIGSSWGVANAALTQVGSGTDLSQDWWKVLLPLLAGGAGVATTVTHHMNAVDKATNEVPPPSKLSAVNGSNFEYLSRIAADCMIFGDKASYAKAGELSETLLARNKVDSTKAGGIA